LAQLMRHIFLIGEAEHRAWLARRGDGFALDVEGVLTPVAIEPLAGLRARLHVGAAVHDVVLVADGDQVHLHLDGEIYQVTHRDPVSRYAEAAAQGLGDLAKAPMPGTIVAVRVSAGDVVAAGQALVVIESMKLEMAINAERAGVVERVHVAVGETFERDATLVTLARPEEG
jgi:acetyl/propionyl-CoA carboxylase alpha subunit